MMIHHTGDGCLSGHTDSEVQYVTVDCHAAEVAALRARVEELESIVHDAYPMLCGIVTDKKLLPRSAGYVMKERMKAALQYNERKA